MLKPCGIQHTFWNLGIKLARLIEIITLGALAHYFEELHAILSAGVSPDLEKIDQINAKYEVSFNMEWVPGLMAKYGLNKLVREL